MALYFPFPGEGSLSILCCVLKTITPRINILSDYEQFIMNTNYRVIWNEVLKVFQV
ncbi:TPA: hypothetical protein JD045_24930, partial [Citrobacter amalonaticus]|nr:hypothetical protein [Citrobacter amalonaticus]